VSPVSSGLLRFPDVPLAKALAWEYALIDVLAPTDSSTVGEENEDMVETETTLLRCIQSMTLVFAAAGGVPGDARGTSKDVGFFSSS